MVMKYVLPHVLDMPMSLGDHLHELRRRIAIPILALVVLFIVGFIFAAQLKEVLVYPLRVAVALCGRDFAARFHIAWPPGDALPTSALLVVTGMAESVMLSMSVAFHAAIALTIPILLYQIWQFVAIGLKDHERRLGFLFIPFGVILFYTGGLVGYFFALPYLYAFLMGLQAQDPILKSEQLLKAGDFHDFFVNLTICCGLIMDLPWLVMVLVRTGLVTVDQFARWRRFIIMINLVLAAVITPTPDAVSLICAFVPMQILFEIGLAASRVLFRRQIAERRAADAKAAADRAADEAARAAEEARWAAEHAREHDDYHRWHDDTGSDAHMSDRDDPHAVAEGATATDGSGGAAATEAAPTMDAAGADAPATTSHASDPQVGEPAPATGDQPAAAGHQQPAANAQLATGDQPPAAGTEPPATGDQPPAAAGGTAAGGEQEPPPR